MKFNRSKTKKLGQIGSRKPKRRTLLRLNAQAHDIARIRKRLISILLVLVGLASAVILIWLGIQFLSRAFFSRNDLFRITESHIECSGDVITQAHVMDYVEMSVWSNLFDVNIGRLRDHLLATVPLLKDVEITRRLPGALTISVIERVPVARLNMESYYLTVDRDGYVLGLSSGSRMLPVVNGHCMPGLRPGVFLGGTAVMNAIDVLDVCETTPIGNVLTIESLDVRDRESLEFRLIGGEQVKLAWEHMEDRSSLSRECLEEKLGRLVNCLSESKDRGKRIQSIDMTLDNNFPAQYN